LRNTNFEKWSKTKIGKRERDRDREREKERGRETDSDLEMLLAKQMRK
jgi:hypothetical protein